MKLPSDPQDTVIDKKLSEVRSSPHIKYGPAIERARALYQGLLVLEGKGAIQLDNQEAFRALSAASSGERIGFWEGLSTNVAGKRKHPFEYFPIGATAGAGIDISSLLSATERYKNGKATRDDITDLVDFMSWQDREMGALGIGGSMSGDLFAFMGESMIAGGTMRAGAAIGKVLAKKKILDTLAKLASTGIAKGAVSLGTGLSKTAGGKLAGAVVKSRVAQGAAAIGTGLGGPLVKWGLGQTLTKEAMNTAASAFTDGHWGGRVMNAAHLDYLQKKYDFNVGTHGLEIVSNKNVELLHLIPRAAFTEIVQNWSEGMGPAIGKTGKALGRGIYTLNKALNITLVDKVIKKAMLRGLSRKAASKEVFDRMLEIGYDGFVTEGIEELFGATVMQIAGEVTGDEEWSRSLADFTDPTQLLGMMIGLGVGGAGTATLVGGAQRVFTTGLSIEGRHDQTIDELAAARQRAGAAALDADPEPESGDIRHQLPLKQLQEIKRLYTLEEEQVALEAAGLGEETEDNSVDRSAALGAAANETEMAIEGRMITLSSMDADAQVIELERMREEESRLLSQRSGGDPGTADAEPKTHTDEIEAAQTPPPEMESYDTRLADLDPNDQAKLTEAAETEARDRHDSDELAEAWGKVDSPGDIVPFDDLTDKQKVTVNIGVRNNKDVVFVRGLAGPALQSGGMVVFDVDKSAKSAWTLDLQGNLLEQELSPEQAVDANFLHEIFHELVGKYGGRREGKPNEWVQAFARVMDRMLPGVRMKNTEVYAAQVEAHNKEVEAHNKRVEAGETDAPLQEKKELTPAALQEEGISRTLEALVHMFGAAAKANDIEFFKKAIRNQEGRSFVRWVYEVVRGAAAAVPFIPEIRVKSLQPLRDAVGGLENLSDQEVLAGAALVEELMDALRGAGTGLGEHEASLAGWRASRGVAPEQPDPVADPEDVFETGGQTLPATPEQPPPTTPQPVNEWTGTKGSYELTDTNGDVYSVTRTLRESGRQGRTEWTVSVRSADGKVTELPRMLGSKELKYQRMRDAKEAVEKRIKERAAIPTPEPAPQEAAAPTAEIAALVEAAEGGDAAAQNDLGVKYAHGDGVLKDEKEGVKWFRKAADQGHTEAFGNLGIAYAHGIGVPKDEKEAAKWYRKAADQGDAAAQADLDAMAAPPKPVEAERPTEVIPGADGREASLILSNGKELPVQYRIVESDSLIPSHDPTDGYRKNKYGDRNERAYEDIGEGGAARATVEQIASNPKPSLLLTDAPTSTDGPPIITASGVVLGGNARAMGQQLAHHRGKEQSATLRSATIEAADRFGVDRAAVEGMKNPVLVRVLSEEDAGARGELSRELNESLTTAKTPNQEAVSRGSKIDETAARGISSLIGDGTLREALADPTRSAGIVRTLVGVGALSDGDAISLRDSNTGALTVAGKDAIEKALLGAVITDVRTLSAAPPSDKGKIIRALPSLIRIKSLSEGFIDSLILAAEGSAWIASSSPKNIPTVDAGLQQPVIEPQPWRDDPDAVAIARLLSNRGNTGITQTEFAKRMEVLAQELSEVGQEQLFGSVATSEESAIENALRPKGDTPLFNLAGPIDSPAFKRWFGDSKIVGEDGQPRVVYHGTTHTFSSFSTERSQVENFLGRGYYFTSSPGDASANYADPGSAPDLTNRVQRRAEEIANEEDLAYDSPEVLARARKEIEGGAPSVLPVYLSIQNPVDLRQGSPTYLESAETYNQETDEYSEPEGTFVDFIEAMRIAANNYYDVDGDIGPALYEQFPEGSDLNEILNWIVGGGSGQVESPVQYATDADGNMASSQIFREALEEMGYDGVIHDANRFRGVNAPPGTTHYIAFNPTQVKSATGNQGTYDPQDADIRHNLDNNLADINQEEANRRARADAAEYNSATNTVRWNVGEDRPGSEDKGEGERNEMRRAAVTELGAALDSAMETGDPKALAEIKAAGEILDRHSTAMSLAFLDRAAASEIAGDISWNLDTMLDSGPSALVSTLGVEQPQPKALALTQPVSYGLGEAAPEELTPDTVVHVVRGFVLDQDGEPSVFSGDLEWGEGGVRLFRVKAMDNDVDGAAANIVHHALLNGATAITTDNQDSAKQIAKYFERPRRTLGIIPRTAVVEGSNGEWSIKVGPGQYRVAGARYALGEAKAERAVLEAVTGKSAWSDNDVRFNLGGRGPDMPALKPDGQSMVNLKVYEAQMSQYQSRLDSAWHRNGARSRRYEERIKQAAPPNIKKKSAWQLSGWVNRMGRALHMRIDMQEAILNGDADSIEALVDKWSAAAKENGVKWDTRKRKTISDALEMSGDMLDLMEEIAANNKKMGLALVGANLIELARDYYTARIWFTESAEFDTHSMTQMARGAQPLSPSMPGGRMKVSMKERAEHRILGSILEGWSMGMELTVDNALVAQHRIHADGLEAIYNVSMRDSLEASGALYRGQNPPSGFEPIATNSPALKNTYAADIGIAKDLSKLTSRVNWSQGQGMKAVRALYKFNSVSKVTILFTSLFHHQAFMRSYYFSIPTSDLGAIADIPKILRASIMSVVNPERATEILMEARGPREGFEAAMSFASELMEGVRAGLTISLGMDYTVVAESNNDWRRSWVEKIAGTISRRAADRMADKRVQTSNWLFGVLGASLKSQAFLLEYRHELQKNKAKLTSGEITKSEIAELVAIKTNDDFGGLNLRRKGHVLGGYRSAYTQLMLRLFALAPDWTESNFNTLFKTVSSVGGSDKSDAVKAVERRIYRGLYLQATIRSQLPTVVWNALMAGLDDEETLKSMYGKAWESGNFNWAKADVTMLSKWFDGLFGQSKKKHPDARTYFSIIGHFLDPWKWLRAYDDDIVGPIKAKLSPVMRIAEGAKTGKDWKGMSFTGSGLLNDKEKTLLKGHLHEWKFADRGVGMDELPSWFLSSALDQMPIFANSAADTVFGQQTAFHLFSDLLGAHVTETYPKRKKGGGRKSRSRATFYTGGGR